jgi:DNA end-binding protein Ku
VFHNREYLVSVRSLDGVLGLHTMRFADELVDASGLDVASPSRAPTTQEIDMAGKLVDTLHAAFRPESFKDTYRERVLDLIARKAKGEEVSLEPPEEPEETTDLMGALEASLAGKKKRSPAKSKSSKSSTSKSSTSKSSTSKSSTSKSSTSKSSKSSTSKSSKSSKSKARS